MINTKLRHSRFTLGVSGVTAAVVVLLLCVKNPVQKDNGSNGMALTLEDKTATVATFSGKPIAAFLTMRDSALYGDLAWHVGSGNPPKSSILPGKKIKDAQVQLLWDIMPVKKDSLGNYYDSVYVSRGGEIYRSNGVRVNVTNVAPVIDSVKISKRVYYAQDTIRDTIKPYDTLPSTAIRVFAHDLNFDPLKTSWPIHDAHLTFVENGFTASYTVPRANYMDTINFSVTDGRGGDRGRVLYLASTGYRNRSPVIDSIRVKDSVFAGSAQTYIFASSSIDSVTFRVFARDSDLTDNISVQWIHKNTKQTALKPKAAEMTMVWACTSAVCKDSVKQGTFKIIDTVTVIVRDNDSASATKSIVVIKGYLGSNKPPIIDSMRIGDTLAKGAWTLLRCQATCRDSIGLRMFGHDPDSADTIHWTVRAMDSTRLKNVSDTAALYLCKDTIYRDTITFLLSDKHLGTALRQVVIDVNNRYPILDSVRCADTLFKTADSLYVKTASVNDSLAIRVYCHDPDAGDSAAVRWSFSGVANDTARFKNISGNQAVYVCKDSLFRDTCGVLIIDKRKAITRKRLSIAIINRYPVIDSVQCGDSLFKSSSALYTRAAAAMDSLPIAVFAHDPDSADALKDTLYSSSKVVPLRSAAPMQYRYVSKDSTYTDTLTILVKDRMLKGAVKKVKLSVTKK